jgi:catechol 2,3-dioxygenase-like lactoylglutathione lyase family enzyme
MITSVDVVTVHVSDRDKALDFYVGKLGFEKRADSDFGDGMRWVEVAPPGSSTRLTLARGFAEDSGAAIGNFTGVVFGTSDVQATHRELSAKGVTFTEPPAKQDWGMWQAIFSDQDGNRFVLVGQQ